VLLFNATIYCEENNIKNWMLVDPRNGAILAVGTHSDLHVVENLWKPDIKIDLEGMFVLPVSQIVNCQQQ
jgi:predicted amidohydrolase YtcJ